MRNRTMFIRGLTNVEVNDLQDLYLTEYKDRPMPAGGFAEQWYRAILHFVAWCEDDVIPKALVDREKEVIERGCAQEYFEVLLSIVDPPDELTNAEKFVMLLGATSGERREALREVLGAMYDLEG